MMANIASVKRETKGYMMNANPTCWFLGIIEWDGLFLFILNFVLKKWLGGWEKHKNLFQNRSSSTIFQCFPSSLYMKRSLKANYIIETRQIENKHSQTLSDNAWSW